MTSDKHHFEELTAPAATAKELQISVATLRKYSLIVERVTGKADYYVRTKQKARLYSKQDLQDLKDFHQLAQEHGLTLQEAAQQVFAVSDQNTKTEAEDKGAKQEVMSTPQMTKLLNAFQQTIEQQNTELANLHQQLDRIEKQNQELLENQQTAVDSEKLAALPDISGIVSETGLEAEVPVERPLTATEKRAQVMQDEQKPSDQVHEEILSKAKENAEKIANDHRTLADMQVEPTKQHWWHRFIDM
ncbi:transcriptional regulator [Lactobacillus xylocopicola]|uniref:Transcriptional regulator n=1 Tax=Lactobacillus xylocopicola TaxID=2976676 RepID=A0ABN6SHW0_9LACO|nr:transcriptional regulator [Lactobacillus xylocopicola]BDR59880.1 transcriptional regulator [Lactobacillus xylocopicola]